MDIQTITQLIGALGFPIVMCLVLFWYIMSKDKRHQEELKMLKDSLDQNTKAIELLTASLKERGE